MGTVTHKTFILEGRIPSKKNSRNIFIRNGRICNLPSSKYEKWHRMAGYRMLAQGSLRVRPKIILGIEISFYFPDNRAADLTNKAESVMDLLVDCRVIKDDCWQTVFSLRLWGAGIDRKKPRAEITIKYIQ